MSAASTHGYSLYWKIWGILLVLTLGMIAFDGLDTARVVMVAVLGLAMLAKAVLIGSYYMHLRWEHLMIGLAVLIGLVVNGFILYGLIAVDAVRIRGMVGP